LIVIKFSTCSYWDHQLFHDALFHAATLETRTKDFMNAYSNTKNTDVFLQKRRKEGKKGEKT